MANQADSANIESMNTIKPFIAGCTATVSLLVVPFLFLTSCDQRKSDIEADKDSTIEKLDQQAQDVDQAAGLAQIQVEESAAVTLADIEEQRDAEKARLEAEKAKAEAEAEAARARIDAVQER